MNNQKKPRSLELFFINGDPEGMLIATVPFQWSGHVLVTNRTQLSEALQRPEMSRPGVYLLMGEDEHQGESLLYIGESDDVGQRIKNHDAKKSWWTTVVCITSSGDQLNKAHVKYIESRLVEKAKQVNKIKLDNVANPSLTPLSEAAVSHMEDFLDNIFLVLPALRFDFFLEGTRTIANIKDAEALHEIPTFVLNKPKYGIAATARIIDGYFVVEKGSIAQREWIGENSKGTSYGKLHSDLIRQNILLPKDSHCVFVKSYAFKSPSAAGAVVNGRSTNGTIEWKLQDTEKTYKDWEAGELSRT